MCFEGVPEREGDGGVGVGRSPGARGRSGCFFQVLRRFESFSFSDSSGAADCRDGAQFFVDSLELVLNFFLVPFQGLHFGFDDADVDSHRFGFDGFASADLDFLAQLRFDVVAYPRFRGHTEPPGACSERCYDQGGDEADPAVLDSFPVFPGLDDRVPFLCGVRAIEVFELRDRRHALKNAMDLGWEDLRQVVLPLRR